MPSNKYKIKAKIWLYPGVASWYLVSLPKTISKEITELFGFMKRGWGSLRVKVKLNNTNWETSIFPNKKTQTYFLPIKKDIRKKENLKNNDMITFFLEIEV